MNERNEPDLVQLNESLNRLTDRNSKQKHIILTGDFNCPDIQWESGCIRGGSTQTAIQKQLIDIATDHSLTQVVDLPTRRQNILDLCFTTNPSLVKNVSVTPGISDHDTVVIDSTIRPQY